MSGEPYTVSNDPTGRTYVPGSQCLVEAYWLPALGGPRPFYWHAGIIKEKEEDDRDCWVVVFVPDFNDWWYFHPQHVRLLSENFAEPQIHDHLRGYPTGL